MDLKEMDVNTMNWVDAAQDGDQWRAFVNAVMYLRVSKTKKLVGQLKKKATCDSTDIQFKWQTNKYKIQF